LILGKELCKCRGNGVKSNDLSLKVCINEIKVVFLHAFCNGVIYAFISTHRRIFPFDGEGASFAG
jgi:hypothetical protein